MALPPTLGHVGPTETEMRCTEEWISPSDSLTTNVRQSTTDAFWSLPGLENFHHQQVQGDGHTIEVGASNNLAWNPRFMESAGHEPIDLTAYFDGLPFIGTGFTSS
jgi:hypothetical protein